LILVFGCIKGRFTVKKPIRSAWQIVVVGGPAALAALLPAKLFNSQLKKWFWDPFECHWLCQCREIAVFTALAKPVAHFFNRLLALIPASHIWRAGSRITRFR
jgi:hypothetical protein